VLVRTDAAGCTHAVLDWLARLAGEAEVRLDDEVHARAAKPVGELVELRHAQQQPEVRDRHVVPVDRVGDRRGARGSKVGDELVPAQVPVGPGVGAAPRRAAKDVAVEGTRCVQVVHRHGQVEAR